MVDRVRSAPPDRGAVLWGASWRRRRHSLIMLEAAPHCQAPLVPLPTLAAPPCSSSSWAWTPASPHPPHHPSHPAAGTRQARPAASGLHPRWRTYRSAAITHTHTLHTHNTAPHTTLRIWQGRAPSHAHRHVCTHAATGAHTALRHTSYRSKTGAAHHCMALALHVMATD